jgi:gas vesicle protein
MSEKSTFEPEDHSPEVERLSVLDEEPEFEFDPDEGSVGEEGWDQLDEGPGDDSFGDEHPDAHQTDTADEVDEEVFRARPGGDIAIAVGALLGLGGLGVMMVTSFAPSVVETVTVPFERVGLTGMSLLMVGILVSGFAVLGRRQAKLEFSVQGAHERSDRLEPRLQYLVDAQEHHLDRPPASGEELDQVLLFLQRQDEKLNNLTKAFKMYGKPLIEITNRTAQTIHELSDLKKTVTEFAEKAESRSPVDEIAKLVKGTRGLTSKELRSELENTIGSHIEKLATKLDQTTEQLAGGVEQVLAQVGDSSDPAMQEVKQGLADIAASLSTLEGRIAQGSASGSTTQYSDSSTGSSPGIGGLAQSIAGAKKAPGKNVLGAIAKLKQMRN